jgi:hypothetical protein
MVIEQNKWEFIEKFEDGTNLSVLKVPSGYLYHYIRKVTFSDIGGNIRTEIAYEQLLHGSADHTIGQTENDSTRSMEKETSGGEVSRIRRSAKRRSR